MDKINKNMHPSSFSDQKKAIELPIEFLSNESTLHRADQFGRTGCYLATTVVYLIAARPVIDQLCDTGMAIAYEQLFLAKEPSTQHWRVVFGTEANRGNF